MRSLRRGKYSRICCSLHTAPWLPSVLRARRPSARFSRRRHAREQTAPLRHVADAQARDIRSGQSGDVAAFIFDFAGGQRHQTRQCLQQRGLAGAVAPQQRDDLAFAHVERRVVENMALAVERIDALRRRRICAVWPARLDGPVVHDFAGRRSRYRSPARAGRRARRRAYAVISTLPWFITVTTCEKPSTRSMSCSTISTGMLAATLLTRFDTRSRSAAASPAERLVEQ